MLRKLLLGLFITCIYAIHTSNAIEKSPIAQEDDVINQEDDVRVENIMQ